MNSENLLLDMYKNHQYESTKKNIQGLVMAMSASGILVGAILTVLLISNILSFYLFASVILCIGVVFILHKFKVISLNTASIIYIIYICFLFIPANWVVADGVNGGTPFVMVIVMLAIMMVFSGKMQRVIQICYLLVMLGLSVYSVLTAAETDILYTIYKSSAFFISAVLIAYYMQYMLKKYDQMHDRFLRGSIKDELTRVLSRSVIDVVIKYTESLFKNKKMDYVMIMIDVDNFKKLNDEYGHVVGDIVLRNTAACIKGHLREEDFVIRYGGDEFLVVLLGASIENARLVFERIENEKQCKRLLDFNITVSRGYAVRSECEEPQDVIKLADKRMYEHKESKRNK